MNKRIFVLFALVLTLAVIGICTGTGTRQRA